MILKLKHIGVIAKYSKCYHKPEKEDGYWYVPLRKECTMKDLNKMLIALGSNTLTLDEK